MLVNLHKLYACVMLQRSENFKRGRFSRPTYSVPEKYLKRDPKPDQPLQTQPKTAYESDTSGCHTVSTAVSTNRKSFLQRLRIRGDWSDTGPTARPIGVTTSIGNESSVSMGNDATGTEGAQQQPDGESSHDSRQVSMAIQERQDSRQLRDIFRLQFSKQMLKNCNSNHKIFFKNPKFLQKKNNFFFRNVIALNEFYDKFESAIFVYRAIGKFHVKNLNVE